MESEGKKGLSLAKALTDIYLWRGSWEGWVFLISLGLAVSGLSLSFQCWEFHVFPLKDNPCACEGKHLGTEHWEGSFKSVRDLPFSRDGRARSQAPAPEAAIPRAQAKASLRAPTTHLWPPAKQTRGRKNSNAPYRDGNQRFQGQRPSTYNISWLF